jgi:hypothetical protein
VTVNSSAWQDEWPRKNNHGGRIHRSGRGKAVDQ